MPLLPAASIASSDVMRAASLRRMRRSVWCTDIHPSFAAVTTCIGNSYLGTDFLTFFKFSSFAASIASNRLGAVLAT